MLRQRREARQECRTVLRLRSSVHRQDDRERTVPFRLPQEDRNGLPVERLEAVELGLAQHTEVDRPRQLGRAP